MIFVIDFENGKFKTSAMLDKLIDGNQFTPIELECEFEDGVLDDFTSYLSQTITASDTVYLFVENTDGPTANAEAFSWVRNNLNIAAVVSANI